MSEENLISPGEVKSLLKKRGMKQKDLCPILKLTPMQISRRLSEKNKKRPLIKLSYSEQCLIMMFFHGERPFDGHGRILFSNREWKAFKNQAQRRGKDPISWIESLARAA